MKEKKGEGKGRREERGMGRKNEKKNEQILLSRKEGFAFIIPECRAVNLT